jgi:hypothetical protein
MRCSVGTIRSHIPARCYSINCRRFQALPQSSMRKTKRANNTSNASQCHSSVTAAQTSWAARVGGEPRPSVLSSAPNDQGSRDSIKALVKADVRPPVTLCTWPSQTLLRHAICAIRFESFTTPCMMPPLTTAECAELKMIISLTPCDEGQTARFA